MTFGYDKLKTIGKTPGGAAETVEKSKLNYSCKAEEKSLYKRGIKYTR